MSTTYAARTATQPSRLDPPKQKQLPILIRFAYCLTIGLWLGAAWFALCFLATVTLGLLFWPTVAGMWGKLPAITTLQRGPLT